MKKNLALVLVLAFILALAINLPVQAEDKATSTLYTTATTTEPVITNFSDLTQEQKDSLDTSKLEKISSLNDARLFKQIIKKEGVMYGIRIVPLRIEPKPTSTKIEISKEPKSTTTATNLEKLIINGKEKIEHPEQIKFFEKITQIGNALFGVRKNDTKVEQKASTSLEKIATPEQIKFFEKITKIGTALFGIRKADAPKPMQLPVMNTETIACVSTAIDTKDTAVASAFTKATADITAAITVRGTCQKTALNLTSGDRQSTINACNRAFQETSKTANETAKKAQKETWTAYDNSLKECAKKNATATSTPEIKIEDGGQNMSEALNQ